MKFFKRNKSQLNLQDKAATGIANGILKTQNWFALNLERVTKNWKRKQQWIFLYLVCIAFGGMSIVAIVNSFKAPDKRKSINPKQISTPKNIYRRDKAFLITEKEFQKVQEYKQTHPNLIKESPGLFDSLTLIEQVYYSQKKR
jgi:hypothetical protein